EVTVNPAARGCGVVRFEFRDRATPAPVAVGFIGLDDDGRGAISLDGLDWELPRTIRDAAGRLSLVIDPPADSAPVRAGEKQVLERSAARNIDADGQAVL